MATPTTIAPTISSNEVYTPNVAAALTTLGNSVVADLNALYQGGPTDAQQATSATAVAEFVIGRLSGTGIITSAYFVPTAASAPASGANSQVLTVNIRNGSGGAALQVAQATLANATPMTAFVDFSLGAITNANYTDGAVLTATTALTGTATLPAGVWVVVSAP